MVSAIEKKSAGAIATSTLERVLINGDLSVLSEGDRIQYYAQVCESVGLNPLTKPFEYIKLNGKLTLYAQKGCTDQLRRIHGISLSKPDIQFEEGLVVVSITASDRANRQDSDVGAVLIGNLQGEARANAIMKAVTKCKRRVTLSICGLGMLDESEVGSDDFGGSRAPVDFRTLPAWETFENYMREAIAANDPQKVAQTVTWAHKKIKEDKLPAIARGAIDRAEDEAVQKLRDRAMPVVDAVYDDEEIDG